MPSLSYLRLESTCKVPAARVLSNPSGAAIEDIVEVWLKCYRTDGDTKETHKSGQRDVSVENWNTISDKKLPKLFYLKE